MTNEAHYSRQLYVLGAEAQQKLGDSRVLLINLRSVGLEIAKNIVLAGINTLYIHDDSIISSETLSTGFFCEKGIGKRIDYYVKGFLKELNPFVNVIVLQDELEELKKSNIFGDSRLENTESSARSSESINHDSNIDPHPMSAENSLKSPIIYENNLSTGNTNQLNITVQSEHSGPIKDEGSPKKVKVDERSPKVLAQRLEKAIETSKVQGSEEPQIPHTQLIYPRISINEEIMSFIDNTALTCVVGCNLSNTECISLCQKARFIACNTDGVFSRVFVDFKRDFMVSDPSGEPPISGTFTEIVNGTMFLVDGERHGLESGDLVKIFVDDDVYEPHKNKTGTLSQDLSGKLDEISDKLVDDINGDHVVTSSENKTYEVKVTSPFSAEIVGYNRNVGCGTFEQVKKVIFMDFEPLDSFLSNLSGSNIPVASLDTRNQKRIFPRPTPIHNANGSQSENIEEPRARSVKVPEMLYINDYAVENMIHNFYCILDHLVHLKEKFDGLKQTFFHKLYSFGNYPENQSDNEDSSCTNSCSETLAMFDVYVDAIANVIIKKLSQTSADFDLYTEIGHGLNTIFLFEICEIHRIFSEHATYFTFEATENAFLLFVIFYRNIGLGIMPVCSVVGGFAAQEVIKACTNKFTPLKQFMYYNSHESLYGPRTNTGSLKDIFSEILSGIMRPKKGHSDRSEYRVFSNAGKLLRSADRDMIFKDPVSYAETNKSGNNPFVLLQNCNSAPQEISEYFRSNILNKTFGDAWEVNYLRDILQNQLFYSSTNNRYASFIQIFGLPAFIKLAHSKVLILGAGAIGCEHLKNAVMMGMGHLDKLVVVDMDSIELSNLNRQFLFRKDDIGKMKAELAAKKCIFMNSDYSEDLNALLVEIDPLEARNGSFCHDIQPIRSEFVVNNPSVSKNNNAVDSPENTESLLVQTVPGKETGDSQKTSMDLQPPVSGDRNFQPEINSQETKKGALQLPNHIVSRIRKLIAKTISDTFSVQRKSHLHSTSENLQNTSPVFTTTIESDISKYDLGSNHEEDVLRKKLEKYEQDYVEELKIKEALREERIRKDISFSEEDTEYVYDSSSNDEEAIRVQSRTKWIERRQRKPPMGIRLQEMGAFSCEPIDQGPRIGPGQISKDSCVSNINEAQDSAGKDVKDRSDQIANQDTPGQTERKPSIDELHISKIPMDQETPDLPKELVNHVTNDKLYNNDQYSSKERSNSLSGTETDSILFESDANTSVIDTRISTFQTCFKLGEAPSPRTLSNNLDSTTSKIVSLTTRVDKSTENIYSNHFFGSIDIIANALDNVETRRYIDGRCTVLQKPLFESGTLGTKGNTQVIVPNMFENYSASSDPPEKEIPLCTLRNFPYNINHCVEYAVSEFKRIFEDEVQQLIEIRDMLTKKLDMFANMQEQNSESDQKENLEKLGISTEKDTIKLLKSVPTTRDECLASAFYLFYTLFNVKIQQWLITFPLDHITSEGTLFWSPPKKAPQPMNFEDSPNNALFIKSFCKLYANCFHNDYSFTETDIQEFYNRNKRDIMDFIDYKVTLMIDETKDDHKTESDFVKISDEIRTEIKRSVNSQIENIQVESHENFVGQKISNECSSGQAHIPSEHSFKHLRHNIFYQLDQEEIFKSDLKKIMSLENISPIAFEKDDPLHIDFLHAFSSIRAQNYRIKQTSAQNAKQIAGKIIPAIATTTAMVSGLTYIEIIKYITQNNNFKNHFISLGLPYIGASDPVTPEKSKYYLTNPDKNCPKDCFLISNQNQDISIPCSTTENHEIFVLENTGAFDDKFPKECQIICKNGFTREYTIWSQIQIKDVSVRDIRDYFSNKYSVEVDMVICNDVIIYASYYNVQEFNKNIGKKISELVPENSFYIIDISIDSECEQQLPYFVIKK